SLLNQLQYAAASYQVTKLIGQVSSGLFGFSSRCLAKLGLWCLAKRRNCSRVISFVPMAKARPICRRCCFSAILVGTTHSVRGEPIGKLTGVETTARVCPWPLTYQRRLPVGPLETSSVAIVRSRSPCPHPLSSHSAAEWTPESVSVR